MPVLETAYTEGTGPRSCTWLFISLLPLDNSPPRQRSRVERLKAKVKPPPISYVPVEALQLRPKGA